MGLFKPKPIYKYRMFDKYKVDIERENEEFRRTDPHHRLARYKLVGETSTYRIYSFFDRENYLLRQERNSPKKVVFFGKAKSNMCVINDTLFTIDKYSPIGDSYHPLHCINIETGECIKLNVLSEKGCFIAMHRHCQDTVESISIKDNAVVLTVTRYKEGQNAEIESTYKTRISYDAGNFTKEIIAYR